MPDNWVVRLVVGAPIFLLGIVLHELGHAWAAFRLGDDTAKRAGHELACSLL